MTAVAYLLDENVDLRLRRALKSLAGDLVVWCVGDPGAPALGMDDPTILRWCEDHAYILVTNNRASMPVHLGQHLASGRHVPGIFVLHASMSLGEIADELALIYEASELEDYADQLSYLPVSH